MFAHQNMPSRKSVCICRKDIADKDRGGISFYYKGIINELVSYGWEVYVITQLPYTNPKVKVINVPEEDDYYKHSINVYKILKDLQVNIIEASNYKFELYEYLKQTKKVKVKPITIARADPSGVTCLFGNEYIEGEQYQTQHVDYNIALSEFAKNDTQYHYNIKTKRVIYIGVDFDHLFGYTSVDSLNSGKYINNRKEIRVRNLKIDKIAPKSKINIFWSGKPTYMKGYDYLEHLINDSPENFNFILNSTPVSRGISWSKKPAGKHTFIWGLDRADQISLWKNCNVTLLPSRVEGFSLVSAESLLLGIPLIANQQCQVVKEFPVEKEILYFNPTKIKDFIQTVELGMHVKVDLDEKQKWFFSSKRMALETHHFYMEVLDARRKYGV